MLEKKRFYNNNVNYTDTGSLYIERKYWNVLTKAKLVKSGLCQVKRDYGVDKFMFRGLFLAPKIKFLLTIDKYRFIESHKAFKAFTATKGLPDHVQYFKMVEGEKFSVMLSKNWKKSFSSGIIKPNKMKRFRK